MWFEPESVSTRNNYAPKIFLMVDIKRWHCTDRSTVLAAPTARVKDKSREGGHAAVGIDPIYDGVQPGVLQQSRARRRSKSQEVRVATWNVGSMVR